MENTVWVVRTEDIDEYDVKILGVFRDKTYATAVIRDKLFEEIKDNKDEYSDWLDGIEDSDERYKEYLDERYKELLDEIDWDTPEDNPDEFAFTWGIDNYFITKTQLL